MSDTIYCYPDSDVLINKLDIRELDYAIIRKWKKCLLSVFRKSK